RVVVVPPETPCDRGIDADQQESQIAREVDAAAYGREKDGHREDGLVRSSHLMALRANGKGAEFSQLLVAWINVRKVLTRWVNRVLHYSASVRATTVLKWFASLA